MRNVRSSISFPRPGGGGRRTILSRPRSSFLFLLLLSGLWTLDARACRFWGLIGDGYPPELIVDHLRDGSIQNLKDLAERNLDGWGFTFYVSGAAERSWQGWIERRGGPPANHPTDPDYDLAVTEMALAMPPAAIGHVRNASIAHLGVPDPHPFQHEGFRFAHNGTIPTVALENLLTDGDPQYLETHPPDWTGDHIDSELFFLYLLKVIAVNPQVPRPEALCLGVRNVLAAAGQNYRLNFVLTDGQTLYALRCKPTDETDPVRYGPLEPAQPTYWFVASEILGSDQAWGTIPPRTLAAFAPGDSVSFYPVDELQSAIERPEGGGSDGGAPPVARADGAVELLSPNPSRDGLVVHVLVPDGGARVVFDVFDSQGRLIWRDGPRFLEAGRARLEWFRGAGREEAIPSGSYFFRVQVGEKTDTQKFTLLR